MPSSSAGDAPVQAVVRPLRTYDVILAILAVNRESAERGRMFPQDIDLHKADRAAVLRVIEMIQWYDQRIDCRTIEGWPSA
jgi:phage tail protein X